MRLPRGKCYLLRMSDLSVQLPKQIGDELRGTNDELEETNRRLDGIEACLQRVESRLELIERRQTEMESRIASGLVAIAGAVRELRDGVLEGRKLREIDVGS